MLKCYGIEPAGMGLMTGRGFGHCVGFAPCGWGVGMGWGKGFGRGRGLGKYFGWSGPQTQKEQIKALSDYKKALLEELEDVKKEEEELSKNQ